MHRLPAFCLLYLIAITLPYPATAGTPHYTIGTGSKGATFYPLAAAICAEVAGLDLGFTCEAVSTPGSRFNLNALRRGEQDFGLSQVYLQGMAARGGPPFATADDSIRSIALLHLELFTLAVGPSQDIQEFADLEGHRVSIGNTGSGSRDTIEQLLASLGWPSNAISIFGLKSSELPEALCSGKIDAAIYSTGHPNDLYRQMIEDCGVRLLDLWSPGIAAFVEQLWQYEPAVLPAGSYANQTEPVRGFGTRVILSGRAGIPECHVAGVVWAIRRGLDRLVIQAPAATNIELEDRFHPSSAPPHPGVQLALSGAYPDCPSAQTGQATPQAR